MALFTLIPRCAWPQFDWGTSCGRAFSLEESRLVVHQFLIHRTDDHVGVKVVDIGRGQPVASVVMDTDQRIEVVSLSDVPLGHKIARAVLDAGVPVMEYGTQIGLALVPVQVGEHVHTHNIKTARW
jgi:(2R)-sulfolactate sulfo-lyase subunit alpha